MYQKDISYSTVINGVKYLMIFEDYGLFWNVAMSSGRKRKELNIYENKPSKSGNSFEVVKWALSTLENFPEKGRLAIGWADGKRRRVYGRYLIPLGFKLMRIDRYLCYSKILKK